MPGSSQFLFIWEVTQAYSCPRSGRKSFRNTFDFNFQWLRKMEVRRLHQSYRSNPEDWSPSNPSKKDNENMYQVTYLDNIHSRKCQRLNQSRQDLKVFLIPNWSPKRVYTYFLQELGDAVNLFVGFLWFLKLLSSISKEKTHFSTLNPFRPVRTRSNPFGHVRTRSNPKKRQHFSRGYP